MKNLDKRNMPVYLIVLSLLLVFPLGVYYIVLKTSDKLHNIKKVANIFKGIGILGIIVGVVYFLCNYSVYVSLIDSHMNIDMYSFNFVYIYMYIIMVVVSSFVGFFKLNRKCENLVIYTEFINVRHIRDINIISEETCESLEEVKENINKLVDLGYLINIKVEGEHLVSTKTVDKNNYVKCKTCGNIEKLYDNNVRCSFCMRKLSKKDRI